jgi:uncharacterized SAM-binding protein YcdF (DUF218 family)
VKAFSLPSRTTDATDAALWGGVLIFAIIVLAVALWLLKRRFFSAASRSERDGLLSLQQLRKMLAEGQITKDEFERLKASAVEAARLAQTGKSSGSARPARGGDVDPKAVK